MTFKEWAGSHKKDLILLIAGTALGLVVPIAYDSLFVQPGAVQAEVDKALAKDRIDSFRLLLYDCLQYQRYSEVGDYNDVNRQFSDHLVTYSEGRFSSVADALVDLRPVAEDVCSTPRSQTVPPSVAGTTTITVPPVDCACDGDDPSQNPELPPAPDAYFSETTVEEAEVPAQGTTGEEQPLLVPGSGGSSSFPETVPTIPALPVPTLPQPEPTFIVPTSLGPVGPTAGPATLFPPTTSSQ